ncbi:hypothetical protein, partial [Klebsiella pneumoniae]|uniref:hypothetical protein n=1 Tax=Klebsiella pneumoniae TaxID=573 RepID=UPI002730599A
VTSVVIRVMSLMSVKKRQEHINRNCEYTAKRPQPTKTKVTQFWIRKDLLPKDTSKSIWVHKDHLHIDKQGPNKKWGPEPHF